MFNAVPPPCRELRAPQLAVILCPVIARTVSARETASMPAASTTISILSSGTRVYKVGVPFGYSAAKPCSGSCPWNFIVPALYEPLLLAYCGARWEHS